MIRLFIVEHKFLSYWSYLTATESVNWNNVELHTLPTMLNKISCFGVKFMNIELGDVTSMDGMYLQLMLIRLVRSILALDSVWCEGQMYCCMHDDVGSQITLILSPTSGEITWFWFAISYTYKDSNLSVSISC